MKLKIKKNLLPVNSAKQQTMESKTGSVDILGQLMFQLDKTVQLMEGDRRYRLPSQTQRIVWPLTTMARGTVINTELTIRIIALDSLPPQERIDRTRHLLLPLGIEIEEI